MLNLIESELLFNLLLLLLLLLTPVHLSFLMSKDEESDSTEAGKITLLFIV